jgi:hypothetical protein
MARDTTNAIALKVGYGVFAADGTQLMRAAINHGCVPSSRMAFSVNPTANDTIAIGGKTFKFVSSLGAAATQVQVKILGSAALTLAALLDAINGVTTDTNWVEASTPFAVTVVADASTATQLRVRWATSRGGLPLPAIATSTAFTASISGGASAWSKANLTVDGKSPADCDQAYGVHTVTAAEITAGFVDIDFDFQPTMQDIYATTSAGVLKVITDTVSLPASQKSLHFAVGGGTALVAGDIIYWWVGV